jgi:DNA-binding transcriptional ArsR family regulator
MKDLDADSLRIVRTLEDQTRSRSYKDTDICVATKLTKGVVCRRLPRLVDAGLIEEFWKGEHGPYFRIPGRPR